MNIRTPEFAASAPMPVPTGTVDDLAELLRTHRRVLAITGAGCSTGSGIPAYRSGDGRWTGRQPIAYQQFVADAAMRRRYWARSHRGWPRMREAAPNDAHRALARLEALGHVAGLLTQNVDGLHGRAGSRNVIELHGTLDTVSCLDCGGALERHRVQARLAELNPDRDAVAERIRPDGDADLDDDADVGFRILDCPSCTGVLKPDVVFFGERVPAGRVSAAWELLQRSDAVLVVGSSLAVLSAYRFVAEAARRGLPVVAVNQGRTRADALLRFKVAESCDRVLVELAGRLEAAHVPGAGDSRACMSGVDGAPAD